ncbi:NINE protein [Leptospira wolffii]|uniref:NINE protein n=1 Tax=Leptospira wolffii TaxID=409998 RepID=A0A2M9ZCA4_9LEPT|nr:NINE protein [Leptospira wolffii]EPG66036.1 TM2 domain protein [Leptospira wolffii serovar Khorat str. Khorat-H2]PJZ66080.1 NINE protein [Leptospira wolffii]TGK59462.1 NINE protein [Leptospira wolffii]TGK71155.1 NINE protein [Leptospira wolffii]TGK77723.1 NINE protein [Leptospira wolffii]
MAGQKEKGIDEKYCETCGSIIKKAAEICPNCGVRQFSSDTFGSGTDWLTALLLCFFLGTFGIHRFYTGNTGIGIAQLLTFGCCGIWAVVDFILILTGSYRDGKGNPLIKKS